MIRFLMTALVFCVAFQPIRADDEPPPRPFDSTWVKAIKQMVEPDVADSSLRLSSFTVTNHSFALTIDSADVRLLPGLFLPEDTLVYGVFLSGRMRFDFRPPVEMERNQLQRFFKSDTLTFTAYDLLLYFDRATWRQIEAAGQPAEKSWDRRKRQRLEDILEPLTDDENYWFHFSVLRAAVQNPETPFLLVCTPFEERDLVAYMFDPYRREPVHLFREHAVPGEDYMELVCRYSEDIDSTYATINGIDRDQFRPVHYDITGSIDNGGTLRAQTTQRLVVRDSSAQFIRMALHPELKVDSVIDGEGTKIAFLRHEDDDNTQQSLYVFLPRAFAPPDTVMLSFYYEGEIAERKVGEFYVEAGSAWYPRLGYAVRNTYDIAFRTPRELTFLLSGDLVDSSTVGDTLITRWRVTRPAANIAFNIGHFTKYDYGTERLPVDLYYNEPLHRHILKGSGQRVYKDVGEDLTKSVVLFDSLFKAYPYERLTVSEIILQHGESFPGFVHLGASTFMATDHWGADHLFRAHEMAHQWFGSTVGYATYHDQWLSEGFAEYAALLYYRQEFGEHKFWEKLKDYRKEIFSARKYLLWDGEESGPIILGFRTASSKTEGDYGLIIYRKAAMVLHMLRDLLSDPVTGDDASFFDMLATYVSQFAGQPVSTAEFQAHVEEFAGQDMTWFFRQWVYQNELPEVHFTYVLEEAADSGWAVAGQARLEKVGRSFRLPLPYEIEYEDGSRETGRLWLERPLTDFRLIVKRRPKKVRVNPFETVLADVK